jgi:hypothetical protein
MSSKNEKIWAVSTLPGSRQTPVHVSRRLIGTAAWKVQRMKEIADPYAEPVPYGKPSAIGESAAIARLEREKAELQAKLDALASVTKSKDADDEQAVSVRKPGRPRKSEQEQTQSA